MWMHAYGMIKYVICITLIQHIHYNTVDKFHLTLLYYIYLKADIGLTFLLELADAIHETVL